MRPLVPGDCLGQGIDMNRKRNAAIRLVKPMIVIATFVLVVIIVVWAVGAVHFYIAAVRTSREEILREDLHVLREGIHSFIADKQKPPQSLKDLVTDGYLEQIPVDPMTHSGKTWVTDIATNLQSAKVQTDSSGIDCATRCRL